ncbi:MAG: sigma-70 family RNA polymerase sigma factor [Kiritimatiellae bacterium]|nr:sigma-70 family RNA polymerase sigma factor [Kiritimatiellia bacterium]
MSDNETRDSGHAQESYKNTHPSLINAVTQGHEPSQDRFYRIYKPLIRVRGAKKGLSPDEIETLVQNVMDSFFRGAKNFKYDPTKRFKHYFYRVINNHICNILREKMEKNKRFSAEPVDDKHPDDREPLDGTIEEEWTQYLYQTAFNEIKGRVPSVTYQVFLLLLQHLPPKEIAEKLGIALSSFYNHKKAAMNEYKKILSELQEGF